MRKSIFDVIFEKYPNKFPNKPSKELRKKIYDRAFVYCSREFEALHNLKPKKADISECLMKRIIFLLDLYQEYCEVKGKYEIAQLQKRKEGTFGQYANRQHSENCNCPICNPEFEPISDKEIRAMEENEKREELEREAEFINQRLRESFDSQFCSRCHRQKDCCICGDD